MSRILNRSLNLKLKFLKEISKISARNFSAKSKGSLILVEINEKTGIATVSLNRPPVNSLNADFMREISKTLNDLEANRARGVILTSVRKLKKIQFFKNINCKCSTPA